MNNNATSRGGSVYRPPPDNYVDSKIKKGSRNMISKVTALTPIEEAKVQDTSVNLIDDLDEVIDSPAHAYLEEIKDGDGELDDFEEDDKIM